MFRGMRSLATWQGMRRFLIWLFMGIVVIPLALVGTMFLMNRYQVSEREAESIRIERDRLMEESRQLDPEGKVDPEGTLSSKGRVVLTDEVLMAEYRLYYANKSLAYKTVNTMTFGFGALCIVLCLVTFAASVLGSGFHWRKLVGCVLPIPFILGGVFLIRSRMNIKLPPNPDDVVCRAELKEITYKNTKTSTQTDEDGHTTGTTTTYYIYFRGRDGAESMVVTSSEYEAVNPHDFCIIASAECGDEVVYFEYYDVGKYKIEE